MHGHIPKGVWVVREDYRWRGALCSQPAGIITKTVQGMPTQGKKWKNKLYFGDNLDILRDKIPDNSVDLIYLDPPFKSDRNYNILFQPEAGEIKGANAQIKTFKDTWKWGEEAERNYEGLITGTITKEKPNQKLIDLMKAIRGYLGGCSMMAYLSMIAPRLLEMRRVLKDTGSIYLHCDPTASHYLKLLMDAIFGAENFRNEIVWHYRTGGVSKSWFGRKHDIILFYSKSRSYKFNPLEVKEYYKNVYGKDIKPSWKDRKGGKDQGGYFHYVYQDDVWDIPAVFNMSKEHIGYPTQKPEKLLERIIKVSSNKGDLVLDPFCGCGTAVTVAERLDRRWIGIDITYLAIDVISKRFQNSGIKEGVDFEIDGEPKDIYSAHKLAEKDPFQFQIWCISKLNVATPSQVKTGDQGVDGIINFVDPDKPSSAGKGIIQVKGTKNVNPSMVRDLKGTLKSQNADFGILITFRKSTQGMINEATKEGYFKPKYIKEEIPRIQFLTIEDLFKNPIPVKLPPIIIPPYKKPIIEKELLEIQKSLFESK